MGKRLLETTFPLLHLLSVVSPYCFWGRNPYLLAVAGPASQLFSLLCTPLLVVLCCFWGGQVALWGFHFHLSCLVCCYCCWYERAFEGDGVSFSQLCRLSFSFLLLYLFVVVGVDRLPSLGTTLDDGAKVTWNNPLYCTSCVSLILLVSAVERFLSKHALADNQLPPSSSTFTFDVLWLSTCCCYATFSTAAFALQSSSCGCLSLFVVSGVDWLLFLGLQYEATLLPSSLDDGAKVTSKKLTVIFVFFRELSKNCI